MDFPASLKHFFLPQESNNHRAKVIHQQSLSLFLVVYLIFQCILSLFLLIGPQVLGYASQISPDRVIELTNQERAKAGFSPLKLNPLLSEAALRKAGDMFAFNYWAHNSPSGRNPWSFFKEVGYQYLYAGENLARDFSSPEAVVSAWMVSPSHRDNLLSPKYKEIGITVVDGTLGGVETTLVVQLFGAPSASVAQIPKQAEATAEKIVAREPKVLETSSMEQRNIWLSQKLPSLSRATKNEKPMANPFLLTKNIGTGILGIIVGVTILDGIIVFRRKTFRLSGRSLAHTMFLAGAILIIILSVQGAIL